MIQSWLAMYRKNVRNMAPPDFPLIVCLCGSTRFYEQFQEANYRETMAGKIVLTVGNYVPAITQTVTIDGCMGPQETQIKIHGKTVGYTPEQKVALDQLHFHKIDICDEVLILNVGGYIGESTRRELEHARTIGKVVRFLEPEVK